MPIKCAIPITVGFSQGNNKMSRNSKTRRITRCTVMALVAGVCITSATGCQVSLNGQTLPSPYYLQDDVQYFPAGPEFKLSREAAAQKAFKAEQELESGGRGY